MLNALSSVKKCKALKQNILPNYFYRYFSSSSPTSSFKIIPFNLADIGEGIAQVEILQWYIKEGQQVRQFDKIAEVQSDKATVEITSRYDGTVKRLYYNAGDVASVGKPLIDIQVNDVSKNEQQHHHQVDNSNNINNNVNNNDKIENKSSIDDSTLIKKSKNDDIILSDSNIKIMPAVRSYARQHNIDLGQIKGSGPNNSITMEDLKKFQRGKGMTHSSASVNSSSSYKVIPLGVFQRAMVKSMTKALSIPHFTYGEELNVTSLEEGIKEGIKKANPTLPKLTNLPIIIKIISDALSYHPILNSHYVDGELREYTSHNIGVAIDTPTGLSVPVIQNVQSKSIPSIARELNNLTQSAMDNRLSKEQLSEGTISISNIGSIGGTMAIPIILPPQVSIIALGRMRVMPRYTSDKGDSTFIIPTPILPLNISADHRVIDGATVAKFVRTIQELITNINY